MMRWFDPVGLFFVFVPEVRLFVTATSPRFRVPARKAFWPLLFLAMGSPAVASDPVNYLFLGGDELTSYKTLLEQPHIAGAQRVYTWRSLEPQKGQYDFSVVEADLALAGSLHKRLFVQVQERFFSADARNVPDYLLKDSQYHGGLAAQVDNPGEGKPQASGWVAKQWDPAVRERFQALLKALAVNLPETAADLRSSEKRDGFSCDPISTRSWRMPLMPGRSSPVRPSCNM